jgi:hypothetical protein
MTNSSAGGTTSAAQALRATGCWLCSCPRGLGLEGAGGVCEAAHGENEAASSENEASIFEIEASS